MSTDITSNAIASKAVASKAIRHGGSSSSVAYRYMRCGVDGSSADVRREKLDGKEYIVCPVIAIIGDEVIWPVNAPYPEFVPASVIEDFPQGWNGRPVMIDHPKIGDDWVSANIPSVIEKYGFGTVYNSHTEDKKLKVEAWLDVEKATRLGGDALSVVERVEKGELVEVSAGSWVIVSEEEGTFSGKKYGSVWLFLESDHLAMLPEGAIGACSVEMGCGAPRVSSAILSMKANQHRNREIDMNIRNNSSNSGANNTGSNDQGKGFRSRFKAMMSSLGLSVSVDGQSANDLRYSLAEEIRKIEPGFDWITDYFPDGDSAHNIAPRTVVYLIIVDNDFQYVSRTYEVDEAGRVTINNDRQLVEPQQVYIPVAASATNETSVPTCGCHKNNTSAHENENPDKGEQTMITAKAKDFVTRLINNSGGKFGESDRKALESLGEDRLEILTERFASDSGPGVGDDGPGSGSGGPGNGVTPNNATNSTTSTTAISTTQAQPMTEEAFLAMAPPSIREILLRHKQEEEDKRADLLVSLSTDQDEWTLAELETMPTTQLEKMSRALARNAEVAPEIDYSGRGMMTGPKSTKKVAPPVDSYDAAFARMKTKAAN